MLPIRTPFTRSRSRRPSRRRNGDARRPALEEPVGAQHLGETGCSISGRRYGPMPSTTLTRPVAATNVPSVTRSGRMRASQGTLAATQSRDRERPDAVLAVARTRRADGGADRDGGQPDRRAPRRRPEPMSASRPIHATAGSSARQDEHDRREREVVELAVDPEPARDLRAVAVGEEERDPDQARPRPAAMTAASRGRPGAGAASRSPRPARRRDEPAGARAAGRRGSSRRAGSTCGSRCGGCTSARRPPASARASPTRSDAVGSTPAPNEPVAVERPTPPGSRSCRRPRAGAPP